MTRCVSSAWFPHAKAPQLGPRRAAIAGYRLRRSRWSRRLFEISRAYCVSISQIARHAGVRDGAVATESARSVWTRTYDAHRKTPIKGVRKILSTGLIDTGCPCLVRGPALCHRSGLCRTLGLIETFANVNKRGGRYPGLLHAGTSISYSRPGIGRDDDDAARLDKHGRSHPR
jgi:hypothetical protein